MSTATRERLIPFSGPMIRAIQAGRKTVTRRTVKPQPSGRFKSFGELPTCECHPYGFHDGERHYSCPYGKPGDRLWVKEALRRVDFPECDGAMPIAHYEADEGIAHTVKGDYEPWRWKRAYLPSMFMPRRLSRITLEITDVRIERLQDISAADAEAEGFPGVDDSGQPHARAWFHYLWESINGPGSWAANPWVFVIKFRRTDA